MNKFLEIAIKCEAKQQTVNELYQIVGSISIDQNPELSKIIYNKIDFLNVEIELLHKKLQKLVQ